MNFVYLIIGGIALLIILGYIFDHKDKMLAKALEDTEREYDLKNKIIEAKQMLTMKKFGSKIVENINEEYDFEKERSVGICPRCKAGFLLVEKKFAGLDEVYNRYPTYNKSLKCSKCEYTESYFNLKKRKNEIKEGLTTQFIEDFNRAYYI